MRVWIDQDQCTGDGLCEDVCSIAFTVGDDGLAYVREDAKHFGEERVFDVGGALGKARIPADWEEAALEAAETCPGECIFVEVD
jgi:ferredoxin